MRLAIPLQLFPDALTSPLSPWYKPARVALGFLLWPLGARWLTRGRWSPELSWGATGFASVTWLLVVLGTLPSLPSRFASSASAIEPPPTAAPTAGSFQSVPFVIETIAPTATPTPEPTETMAPTADPATATPPSAAATPRPTNPPQPTAATPGPTARPNGAPPTATPPPARTATPARSPTPARGTVAPT